MCKLIIHVFFFWIPSLNCLHSLAFYPSKAFDAKLWCLVWQYRLWNFQLGDTEKWAKNNIFSNSMLGCHEKAKTLDFKKVCSLSCKKKIEIEIKTCFVNWRYFCQFKKSHMKNVFIKGISIRDQMKISSYSPCLTFTCNTRPIMPWSQ